MFWISGMDDLQVTAARGHDYAFVSKASLACVSDYNTICCGPSNSFH